MVVITMVQFNIGNIKNHNRNTYLISICVSLYNFLNKNDKCFIKLQNITLELNVYKLITYQNLFVF